MSAVPLASGAQLGDLLARHLLGAHVVRLGNPVQRYLAGFENNPVARTHIGWQLTRVAIQFSAAQFNPESLLHHGHNRFGDDFMRHSDYDAVGYLLREHTDMLLHIAREYLVAKRLDYPLLPAGQMQARSVLEAEIAGV